MDINGFNAVAAVVAARNRGLLKHGGIAADDNRMQCEWREFVRDRINQMVQHGDFDLSKRRAEWVSIAAVALSAAESFDRRRHVDEDLDGVGVGNGRE